MISRRNSRIAYRSNRNDRICNYHNRNGIRNHKRNLKPWSTQGTMQ
jgi:hypothetical protein